jgi:hypothetical protein
VFKIQETSKNDLYQVEKVYEKLNFTDSSAIFANEVTDFGIDLALAEEHINLGNYEEAIKLAKAAMKIGDHT